MSKTRENNQDNLRDFVLSQGCYSREENERIFEKWFAKGPRFLFRAVDKKYGITEQVLCDVGCAYGMNLVSCAPGSYGIEVEPYEVNFAQHLGLTVYKRDIIEEDVCDLPKADVVWCSAILEHVVSPHILLRKLHQLLRPEGILALYVPTLPIIPVLSSLPRLGKYFLGHRQGDHINAFVPQTLRFFCERAGFATVELSPFFPSPLSFLDHLPGSSRLIDGCVYIGRSVENWEYPEKATRRASLNKIGFMSVGQRFPTVTTGEDEHSGE
jgi:2-polyprenyl-3-methyl-5-hydroxy-6-metoxy-1,4-benzoquinol methylase